MKRSIFSAALVILSAMTFISCSKSGNSDGKYYIKGTKEGVAFNYTSNAQAYIGNISNYTAISMMATLKPQGTSIEALVLNLTLMTGTAFETRQYSETQAGSGFGIGGVYSNDSQEFVWDAGNKSPSARPMKITYLTITENEVSGTFESAFYKTSTTNPPTYYDDYIIIEGEFRLPIVR